MACIETRNITVHAAPNGADYDFSLSENGQDLGGRITCESPRGKPADDYHEFIFTLRNDRGSKLRFEAAPATAMWVKKGWWVFAPTCPKTAHSHPHIQPVDVAKSGDQLTVRNYNPEKVKYKFALNFVTPGGEQVSYDPIWDNQNGSAR